jgi:hypothetical protein
MNLQEHTVLIRNLIAAFGPRAKVLIQARSRSNLASRSSGHCTARRPSMVCPMRRPAVNIPLGQAAPCSGPCSLTFCKNERLASLQRPCERWRCYSAVVHITGLQITGASRFNIFGGNSKSGCVGSIDHDEQVHSRKCGQSFSTRITRSGLAKSYRADGAR